MHTPKVFRHLALVVVAVLVLTTVAACGSKDSGGNSASTSAPVKVLLNTMPQIQYIGIHAAEGQGFYQDKELNVEFLYSEPNTDIATAVLAGQAQFGVVGADQVLQARSNGESLVAVMALYQRDPTAVLSLKTKEIQRPSDLVGKTILLWSTTNVSFMLFAQAAGIDIDQMTLVYPEGTEIMESAMLFLNGQVDAMVVPGIDVAVQLESMGLGSNALFVDDYGVANYPNVLVTTDQMIREHPEVVQHFVSATLLGLQHAVSQPEATASWFVENYRDQLFSQQLGAQTETLFAVLPLINPVGFEPGVMTHETWQYVFESMVALDRLNSTVDFTKAYTLEFVEDFYNASP